MDTRSFRQLLQNQWRRDRMVCVGLDPDWERIPSALKTQGGMERDPAEVSERFDARNPAFDVTPAALIAAIVTEEGVHTPPYEESLPSSGGAA